MGSLSRAHRRTKSILPQMLVLRGRRDFSSVDEYQRWLREAIDTNTMRCALPTPTRANFSSHLTQETVNKGSGEEGGTS